MAGYLPFWLLRTIYPLKEVNYTRERPLEVLALGLGRTGTESLAQAFDQLGLGVVYHGYRLGDQDIGACPQWVQFGVAKYSSYHRDPRFLTRERFDKVLGHCSAVTDLPTVAFAVELLRAYPDAKVVLNRRKDIDAWYESQLKTIASLNAGWRAILRSFFDSELFWLGNTHLWTAKQMDKGDFVQNGKKMYVEHYAELKEECRKQGREWLDWTVQDGWEPLCKFLNKAVPDQPFPEGNSVTIFQGRAAKIFDEMNRRADRNMTIVGAVLMVGIAAILSFRYNAWQTIW